MPPAMPLDPELSDEELTELDRFLASPELVDSSLDVFSLEGFFAAIVATPRPVPPSEWTPWIWDADHGEISPEFENAEQKERIFSLVMRLHDAVAAALAPGAGEFAPLFAEGDAEAGSNWCSGFLAGTQFESEAWSDLIDEKPKWFAPILGLGLEDEEGPRPRQSQIERWTRDIGPAVTRVHAYWLAQQEAPAGASAASPPAGSGAGPEVGPEVGGRSERAERSDPTPGRNALCPCGSGRKFKRCCGTGAAHST